MSEISPRITYSPEGILEVRRTTGEDAGDIYTQHKETVDSIPGYEVIDEGPETIIRVEVQKVVYGGKKRDLINSSAKQLIESLSTFTHFDYRDPRDGVFSLDFWSANYGAKGVVFPQFQRWLNAGVLDETIAKNCINAMAYPMGAEAHRQAKKDFLFRTDGENVMAGVGGFTFGVMSKRDTFGVAVERQLGDEYIYKNGKVEWNWLNLSTIGSCACWGADWEQRREVYITSERQRLYEMNPHNVDFATQSLSLVLGAAVLAYEAAQYEGTEDILANTQWYPPRNF